MAPDPGCSTAERLRRAALQLFARQGFRATTVEQIAAAAGVSHMTFFRHFPTKESVVVSDPYDPTVAEAVAATDRTLPTVERVRRGILSAWAHLPDSIDDESRLRIALVAGERSLRAAMWEANDRTIDAIAEALTIDGVERGEAAAAAGACVGALTVGLLRWGSHPEKPIGAVVERALSVLATAGSSPDRSAGAGPAGTRHGQEVG